MTDNFKILVEFLEHFGQEVEGRKLTEPPPEIQDKLRELALGRLPEAERPGLFALLNRNPDWIASLAREVKALRAGAGATESEA
jgi:hypothetical protein